MVVHMEFDPPKKPPLIKQATFPKSLTYKIIETHVREVPTESQNHLSENVFTQDKKKRKNKKESSPDQEMPSVSTLSEIQAASIDKNDLEELISVYRKCKEVVQKIELKYGHLINLEDNKEGEINQRKRKLSNEVSCTCEIQRKIIFDEFGNPTEQPKSPILDHICVKKTKQIVSYLITQPKPLGLKIEYDEVDNLPNDLKSLLDILKTSNSDLQECRKIVKKIKLIQEEFRYELKFSKPFFIVKIKSEPENLFEFPGSNLFSLPGYPVYE